MRLRLSDQPVAYSAAFKAILAAIVIIGAITLTGEQVAALSVAFDAVLGVLVFASVQPNNRVEAKVEAAKDAAKNETLANVASLGEVAFAELDTIKPARKKSPVKKAAKR